MSGGAIGSVGRTGRIGEGTGTGVQTSGLEAAGACVPADQVVGGGVVEGEVHRTVGVGTACAAADRSAKGEEVEVIATRSDQEGQEIVLVCGVPAFKCDRHGLYRAGQIAHQDV